MTAKRAQTKGEAKTAEREAENKATEDEKAAKKALEDDRKRQEREAKAAEKRKKEQANKDYKGHLTTVEELKEMTDTTAWKKFHTNLQRRIDGAAKAILDAEKPRDVIRCQESVKLIRAIIAEARTPVDALDSFCNAMPLFAQNFSVRAAWNDGLGIVELSGQKPKK